MYKINIDKLYRLYLIQIIYLSHEIYCSYLIEKGMTKYMCISIKKEYYA